MKALNLGKNQKFHGKRKAAKELARGAGGGGGIFDAAADVENEGGKDAAGGGGDDENIRDTHADDLSSQPLGEEEAETAEDDPVLLLQKHTIVVLNSQGLQACVVEVVCQPLPGANSVECRVRLR